ncbi:MAG: hypothetical protein ACLRNQ_20640 [Flavonifractor plautii]
MVFDTEEAVKIPTGINVPPPAGTTPSWGTSCPAFGRKALPSGAPGRILAVLDLLETALEADGSN